MLKILKKAIVLMIALLVMLLPVGMLANFTVLYPLNLQALVLKIYIYYPHYIPFISMIYLDNSLILNYINASLLLMIILAFIYIARSKNFKKMEKITIYVLSLLMFPVIMIEILGYRNLTIFWIMEWFLCSSIVTFFNYHAIHMIIKKIKNKF
jgi:hypothetical protein